MDEDDIATAIAKHPVEAAEALAAIQFGATTPLTVDSLRLSASVLGTSLAGLWFDQLKRHGSLAAFGAAMGARGIVIPTTGPQPQPEPEPEPECGPEQRIDGKKLSEWTPKAMAFGCRIIVDHRVVGSGALVGPTLVLTAWHVVAAGAPNTPDPTAASIQVSLSDGTLLDATVPPRLQSYCGDAEFGGRAPRSDTDVVGRNDVALLALDRPVATHLGTVPLPPEDVVDLSRCPLIIRDFPKGIDKGFPFGKTRKIRNVSARWRHDIVTDPGSSGGACFNGDLVFVGLHQGKWGDPKHPGGRLVPLSRFIADVRPFVEQDVAPLTLWSLDGSVEGRLVIGRDPFFQAVAAAGKPAPRVRGVRIKRLDIDAGPTGLAFSHEILKQLLARKGFDHLLVRVPFDGVVADLPGDMVWRVRAAGLEVTELESEPGVAEGQATPEAAAGARAAVLAGAVNAAAAQKGVTVWFFFDNPSVVLSEPTRFALEGFVSAALVQPRLRMVLAGFETVQFAGEEFATAGAPSDGGPPGFLVEFLGGFTRTDLLDFLTNASKDLKGSSDPQANARIADRVLLGIPSFNNAYRQADLAKVKQQMRADLSLFQAERDG